MIRGAIFTFSRRAISSLVGVFWEHLDKFNFRPQKSLPKPEIRIFRGPHPFDSILVRHPLWEPKIRVGTYRLPGLDETMGPILRA